MAPFLVTAIIYFFRPNLSSCSSDIANFDKLLMSIDDILLKSNNDCRELMMISVKSETYYLTLSAKLSGTFINFSAIPISRYAGVNKFL